MRVLKGRRGSEGILGLLFGKHASYVRRLGPLFVICVSLYFFSLFMGFYLGDKLPGNLLEDLREIIPNIENFNLLTLFFTILLNNVSKLLMWMLLGIIGAAPSVFFLIMNGFIAGWVSYLVSSEFHISVAFAGLVPHGIIEFPVLFLTAAMGMALGYHLLNRIRGKGSFRTELMRALNLFIMRIFPLILLAAIIEVTITPIIVALLIL